MPTNYTKLPALRAAPVNDPKVKRTCLKKRLLPLSVKNLSADQSGALPRCEKTPPLVRWRMTLSSQKGTFILNPIFGCDSLYRLLA